MKRFGNQFAVVAVQGLRSVNSCGVGFVTFAASRVANFSILYERSVPAHAAEANIEWVIQDAV